MSFSIADDYAAMGDDLVPFILPDDVYQLLITKAETGTTGTQKPKINLTFEVAEGPHMGRSFASHIIWSTGGNPIAARISASSFAVCGAPRAWIRAARPSNEEIAGAMVGNVIEAKVGFSDFGGMPKNEIKNFNKTVSLNNPAAVAAAAYVQANGVPGGVTLGQQLPQAVPGGVTLGQALLAEAQAQQPPFQPQAQPQPQQFAAAAQPTTGLPGGWPTV